jgi:hypothetical protein
MSRAALLSLLLLALANLALVHCSKGNSTAAKLKRCSACQIFVQELHDQMSKSADTKETILKQVPAQALPAAAVAVALSLHSCAHDTVFVRMRWATSCACPTQALPFRLTTF